MSILIQRQQEGSDGGARSRTLGRQMTSWRRCPGRHGGLDAGPAATARRSEATRSARARMGGDAGKGESSGGSERDRDEKGVGGK
jgi:hypothetical protein